MFERAEERGAALKIEGPPGGGTTLSLELPLDTKAGATH
jgi:signal transduction histidine kinase